MFNQNLSSLLTQESIHPSECCFLTYSASPICLGRLVAIAGIVGCGKTTTLRRLFNVLEKEGKILVSKSLSVDKARATLATLISALFYDLSADQEIKIPTQGEKRERELRDLIRIEQHLTLAFEAAYLVGEKPVTLAIVDSVLSKQIDDLEPTLTRHGYDVRGLAEQFNAKPAEIRSLFRGQLDPMRVRELQEQMLMAGLPI